MSRFRKWISNIIKTGKKDISISDPESFAEFYHQLSLNNPFRQLTGKELEAVTVMDNRELFKSESLPNNKIFLTSPHTSNDVKYMPLNKYDKQIISSQNAYDIGAFELITELSEELK